jgi:hypothetical protein
MEPPMYKGPEQFLDSDAVAGKLMAHARLLLKLSQRFEAIAPAGLRHSAHVANYKSGKIVIHADNGAVATKIRQMGQRLCSELSKGGAECTDIDVKVQPRLIPFQSTSSTPKPLSEAACDILKTASESLPKGALRDALATLIARAATRG